MSVEVWEKKKGGCSGVRKIENATQSEVWMIMTSNKAVEIVSSDSK